MTHYGGICLRWEDEGKKSCLYYFPTNVIQLYVICWGDEGKKSCLHYFLTNVICFFVPCDSEKIGKHCFKTETFTHKDKKQRQREKTISSKHFQQFFESCEVG